MDIKDFNGQYLHYGKCPNCGEPRQPDGDDDEEYVVCCDCKITWSLYHEDETDKRDETEPWRTYRIGDVESFDALIVTPYECD
jgi:hypothetical protein